MQEDVHAAARPRLDNLLRDAFELAAQQNQPGQAQPLLDAVADAILTSQSSARAQDAAGQALTNAHACAVGALAPGTILHAEEADAAAAEQIALATAAAQDLGVKHVALVAAATIARQAAMRAEDADDEEEAEGDEVVGGGGGGHGDDDDDELDDQDELDDDGENDYGDRDGSRDRGRETVRNT